MARQFTEVVESLIKAIPKGKVATYGQIAALAGSPRGARQVVRILHSCSEKADLPWFRMVNAKGEIALPRNRGYELQRALLVKEGVRFVDERIELTKYGWKPSPGLLGRLHRVSAQPSPRPRRRLADEKQKRGASTRRKSESRPDGVG